MAITPIKMHGQDRITTLASRDEHEHELHIWEADQYPEMVFLAIHGGMSHAGDYQTLGEHFRERGITTVSFNLRGHGRSNIAHFKSYKSLLEDISDIISWLEQQYAGVPIFVVGHSMGGLLATCFALNKIKGHDSVKAYVLSSPYFLPITSVSLMEKLGILLAAFVKPEREIPVEGVDDKLTRDQERTDRIRQEIEHSFRAQSVTVKMAQQILKAQKLVKKRFNELDKDILVLIAGDECLSCPSFTQKLLSRPQSSLISSRYYPVNQHENFNELNRSEIFHDIERWCRNILARA